jgi:hypothetical protein
MNIASILQGKSADERKRFVAAVRKELDEADLAIAAGTRKQELKCVWCRMGAGNGKVGCDITAVLWHDKCQQSWIQVSGSKCAKCTKEISIASEYWGHMDGKSYHEKCSPDYGGECWECKHPIHGLSHSDMDFDFHHECFMRKEERHKAERDAKTPVIIANVGQGEEWDKFMQDHCVGACHKCNKGIIKGNLRVVEGNTFHHWCAPDYTGLPLLFVGPISSHRVGVY